MANERLRAAIYNAGLRLDEVADAIGCDRKTVERWIEGHVPYRRNQYALARLVEADPGYLWPAGSAETAGDLAMAELLGVWPVRSQVPVTAWVELFAGARQRIDILCYAAFWLSEEPAVRETLAAKARGGVPVRMLLGDPGSKAVRRRGDEEGIGDAVAAKITNTMHNYRELFATPGAELRLHDTTLYASVYRADDDMLASTHLYGLPGHMTPLLRLRRVPGAQLFASYADSFERVWDLAHPVGTGQQVA